MPVGVGGGEADGTEFAGVMAQRVFSTIGTAAEDVAAVFGNEAPDLSAAFMVWALQETERQGGGCNRKQHTCHWALHSIAAIRVMATRA